MDSAALIEAQASGRNSHGEEIRAQVSRLTRHSAVFEIYTPAILLNFSEALTDFKITCNGRTAYAGRAVVSNLLKTGSAVICEVTLEESWLDVESVLPPGGGGRLRADFQKFMAGAQKTFKILPEFKIAVADLQMFLLDLRGWMEQVEMSLRARPEGERAPAEREAILDLREPLLPALGRMFERFEEACGRVAPDLRPAHQAYVKRQLHPLVLCAPFMYRTFQKPLGYAGDYEMVSMMMRDPQEGDSMYAKMLNTFFLGTPPVVAHCNRIVYLKKILVQEASRARRRGRPLKIFNLGCGPAREVQEFLAESELSNHAQFTLLDFNDQTLASTGQILEDLKRRHQRSTGVRMVKKSVAQVIKEAGRAASEVFTPDYDLVYCAGLFDYMPDHVCERLMSIFHNLVAPGGLLLATNVDEYNPSRNWMEFCVDWHLIYRNHARMLAIAPKQTVPENCHVLADLTGVNVFIEIRKPEHGG